MERLVLHRLDVMRYLNNLIEVLFNAQYFSYRTSSQEYLKRLGAQIKRQIQFRKHFETPKSLNHLSENFFHFRVSKNTT